MHLSGEKAGHCARFCFQPEKALTHSTRDSPASIQSADRAHATGDKVQLNQYDFRGTKSPHGITSILLTFRRCPRAALRYALIVPGMGISDAKKPRLNAGA
jgi:hypothetical protein